MTLLFPITTTHYVPRFAALTSHLDTTRKIDSRESTSENNKISFVQSKAEELAFAGNESADLVAAGALSGSN